MKRIVDKVGWGIMLTLACVVTLYAFTYLFIDTGGDSPVKQRFLERPLVGYSHLFGGGLAILLGPFALSTRFRKRNLNLHRWMGRAYLIGVLFSGLAGLYSATPCRRHIVLDPRVNGRRESVNGREN